MNRQTDRKASSQPDNRSDSRDPQLSCAANEPCPALFIAVLMTVRDGCPENALEKAMKCTAGLGIGPPFISNAFIERGQIQFAKDACR